MFTDTVFSHETVCLHRSLLLLGVSKPQSHFYVLWISLLNCSSNFQTSGITVELL